MLKSKKAKAIFAVVVFSAVMAILFVPYTHTHTNGTSEIYAYEKNMIIGIREYNCEYGTEYRSLAARYGEYCVGKTETSALDDEVHRIREQIILFDSFIFTFDEREITINKI